MDDVGFEIVDHRPVRDLEVVETRIHTTPARPDLASQEEAVPPLPDADRYHVHPMTEEAAAPNGDLPGAQADKPQSPAESTESESNTCEMPCLATRQRPARFGFDIAPPSHKPKASRLIGPPARISDQRDPPLPSALSLVP
jgi:hypothetical protein